MPGIHETPTSFRTFAEQASAPAAAGTGEVRLYVGDDGILRWVDDGGDVVSTHSLEPVDYGGTSRTLEAQDFFRFVRFTNSNPVEVTIPTEAGAGGSVGTTVWIHSMGAGGATVVGASGVTINGTTEISNGETIQYVEVDVNVWMAVDHPGRFPPVNVAAATGAAQDVSFGSAAHDLTMDQDCTFAFVNPPESGNRGAVEVIVRGAFTPTWPAEVDWPGGVEPTYASSTLYRFVTVDGGTTVLGYADGTGFA